MKKSMIAIGAAALCATVFGSIQSANVVGYSGSDLNLSGATMTSAMFINVGSTTGSTKFKHVVPVAAEGVDLVGNVEIQYLNNDGSTDFSQDFIWDGSEWLDANYDDASEIDIPAGKGLWTYNTTGGNAVKLRSEGEVNVKDLDVELNLSGATAAANAFPLPTTFGEIVPIAAKGVDLMGNVEIQYLNNDGSTDFSQDFIWDGEKWLDANYDDASLIAIPAGKGLWTYNTTGGSAVTLRIAAPEL